jgi:SNF2 family DNA or RNA helicase
MNAFENANLALPHPLREYQWQGVSFLLAGEAALLADEMGLGKTVQAVTALQLALRLPECNRALVVAPASLQINWEREVRRWAPTLAVRRVRGNSRNRLAMYQLPIPILIASYEQIRSDAHNLLSDSSFDVVLLDEAQRIKNSGSGTALACKLLSRSRAWALSGTPVENSSDDLISIFSFLKPGMLHSGMPRDLVHDRIKPFFLRRRKEDVLGEMPPITIQDIPLELEGAQLDGYTQLWEGRHELVGANGLPATEMHMLALLTKLKQQCNYDRESNTSVKLDALQELLETIQSSGEKVLIFSQYVETLSWLSERISINHRVFHGGLSAADRDKAVSDFESATGSRALLISLKAGGVGLNLNSASTVVMFDRWWNPAVENQAIQRAHRFGRRLPLQVFRFLVEDTVEQRIAELLEEKEALFEDYVEQADGWVPTRFSRDELRRILSLSTAETDGPAWGPDV